MRIANTTMFDDIKRRPKFGGFNVTMYHESAMGVSVLDFSAYTGFTAVGAATVNMLLGMLMASVAGYVTSTVVLLWPIISKS